MTGHVCVTYASGDGARVRDLADALVQDGRAVVLHAEDSAAGPSRLEGAGALIFVISRESIVAPGCLCELALADQGGIRIVPLALEPVPPADCPTALNEREWVVVDDEAREIPWLRRVAEALDVDPSARAEHERVATRTAEWLESGRDASFLLRRGEP